MVTNKQLILNLKALVQEFEDNQSYLTELDTKIGDGDHGNNMKMGFTAIDFSVIEDSSITDIFKHVAMKLISTVGGASGPLYGTFFMEFAKATVTVEQIDISDYKVCLTAAIQGIQKRGGAKLGDKTLLDVLIPFTEELEKSSDLDLAKQVAQKKASETKEYVALKGRASYLNERSIGHMDPGCASMLILLEGII